MNVCIDWHQKWGPAEVWSWACLAVLVLVNYLVARSKDTKAQTIFQFVVSALISKFGGVALLGSALRLLSARYPESPPSSFATATTNPPAAPPPAAALLIIAGLGMVSGCAMSPAGRAHVALATAAQIGQAADKAITAANEAFQADQVEQATAAGSTIDARAKLAEWRPKISKARASVQVYYAGLIGYQVALQTADSAQDKKFNYAAFIVGVTKMGTSLLDGLRGLGVNIPSMGVQ